jgi:hypothetical protein
MEWPIPKDVADIRSFMGITGYYRRFIEGFSKIVYPITSLQKKGIRFTWSQKCQDNFDKLKGLLTTTPILRVVDLDKYFIVFVDASKEGLGGVLIQDGHVICYESRKLKEHERNYITHDLELETVIHALKMWRNYLMGRKFLLLTNNCGVKFLFSQLDLNARQARWLSFLGEFDFEVRNIKGKENKVAYALSRRTNRLFEISFRKTKNNIKQRIKSASCNDEKYIKTTTKLQENAKILNKTYLSLDKNGLLRFKNRLYVLDFVYLKPTILEKLHKRPYFGHPGYQKMITALIKLFYWPNMKSETTEYLSKCLNCQQVKVEHQHPVGLLHPLPIPKWKWEIISLDFIIGFPKTQNKNDLIMVVIDKLIKFANFIPMKSTYKAINIAKFFMKEIFRLHGISKMVIFDRDVKFTSKLWKELFVGLDTNINFSASYHPQTDGKTEQSNQIVEDMLRMYVRTKPTN